MWIFLIRFFYKYRSLIIIISYTLIIFFKFQKIVKYEQSNEKLTNKINDYNINIAADKQSIQQLTCKIKELEEEQSAKIMEHNLDKSSFEGNDKLNLFYIVLFLLFLLSVLFLMYILCNIYKN